MSIKGIDVSSYQGKPDWAKVAAAGIDFAILRVANSKGKDTSFEHNFAGCEENGIEKGVYRYSYAMTTAEAVKEAQGVVEILAGRKLELGVWLDLEWKNQRILSKSALTKIAQAFIQTINDAGYSCGIYCNVDWYKNVLDVKSLKVPFWVARYPSGDNGTMKESLKPNVGEVAWQYSSKGKVSGITGNVDMDIYYPGIREEEPIKEENLEDILDEKAVRSLQEALNADGITDENGNPLDIDGKKGPLTASAIAKLLLKSGAFDTSKGLYTVGSTGEVVKWLQMRLNTVIGNDIIELLGHDLEPDGKLGADTRLAIGLFQEMRGLAQDYIAGAKTITELLRAV